MLMPAAPRSAVLRTAFAVAALFAVCRSEIVVAPGEPIQAALDASSSGDTLRLLAGDHPGPVTIDTRVSLIGDDGARVVGPGAGVVVTINAPGTVVSGLMIVGSGQDLMRDDAGITVFADRVRIADNNLIGNLHGIYLNDANQVVVTGNSVVGRPEIISSDRGNGIHLFSSAECAIVENAIEETRDGIYMSFADSNLVNGNRVYRVRYGLHYMYSDYNRFAGNVFSHNTAGAALMYSRGIMVEGNRLEHNRRQWAHGMLFQACDDCVVRGNILADNADGFFLGNSNRNRFEGNAVVGNDAAVTLLTTSARNTFTRNRFEGNLTDLALQGAADKTNLWSVDGVGNYWNRYRGYDIEGDGIGEEPHALTSAFEHLESQTPGFRLYLGSPAADALNAAERALPVFEVPAVLDTAPLVRAPAVVLDRSGQGAIGGALAGLGGFLALGCVALVMRIHRT